MSGSHHSTIKTISYRMTVSASVPSWIARKRALRSDPVPVVIRLTDARSSLQRVDTAIRSVHIRPSVRCTGS